MFCSSIKNMALGMAFLAVGNEGFSISWPSLGKGTPCQISIQKDGWFGKKAHTVYQDLNQSIAAASKEWESFINSVDPALSRIPVTPKMLVDSLLPATIGLFGGVDPIKAQAWSGAVKAVPVMPGLISRVDRKEASEKLLDVISDTLSACSRVCFEQSLNTALKFVHDKGGVGFVVSSFGSFAFGLFSDRAQKNLEKYTADLLEKNSKKNKDQIEPTKKPVKRLISTAISSAALVVGGFCLNKAVSYFAKK